MTLRTSLIRGGLSALAVLLVAQNPAHAQTTWNAGTAGNMSVPGNWNPAVVPTSSTDVIFDISSTANAQVDSGLPSSTFSVQSITKQGSTSTQTIVGNATTAFLQTSGNLTTNSGTLVLRNGAGTTTLSVTVGGDLNASGGNIQFGQSNGSSTGGGRIEGLTVSGNTNIDSGRTVGFGNIVGTANLGSLQMNGTSILNLISGNSAANGTPDGGNNTVTVNRLNGNGTIQGDKESATLTTTGTLVVDGSINGTFSGTIINNRANNVIALTKAGSSTLTLTGNNSYSGNTTVNGGTLLVNNTVGSGTGTGSVTVNSGGTLGGNGTISGSVTINNGGTLSPGNSPGILNTGSLSIDGTLSMNLNGLTAGSQYDQVSVTGTVTLLSSSSLSLSLGFTPAVNDRFFLIINDGSDDITGTIGGLAQGATFTASGYDWQISYLGDSIANTFTGGNDLVIQVIPEPSTWGLLAASLSALLIFRRRSR